MALSTTDFAEAFPGEGDHIEFKKGVSVSRVQEAVVAFSSSDGGVLIAGVTDEGRVVGVDQPGEKAKALHQALREARDPGRYEIRDLDVDVDVAVPAGPVVDRRRQGFSQTSAGVVLVRQGASNAPLLGASLSRFISRHAFEAFELTPTNVNLAAASPQLLERLCHAHGWDAHGDLTSSLENAWFAAMDEGRSVLTVAGSLLLLDDPSTVGGRPYVDIRRHSGDDPDPDNL